MAWECPAAHTDSFSEWVHAVLQEGNVEDCDTPVGTSTHLLLLSTSVQWAVSNNTFSLRT